jgi:hypothetical protein
LTSQFRHLALGFTLGDDAEDLGDFEVLEEHVESIGRVPLVFCITTHGMGCGGGPLSSSIYVGLDLAAERTNQPA